MPGVQRERDRDEVRASAGGRRRVASGAPVPRSGAEHAVEQLEVVRVGVQDRLRACRSCPTSTSRTRHRRRTSAGSASGCEPGAGEQRGRARRRRARAGARAPGDRGLTGTNTAPASHTPNIATIASGPLGSCTATAWPGSTPAARSVAAITRAAWRAPSPADIVSVGRVQQRLVVRDADDRATARRASPRLTCPFRGSEPTHALARPCPRIRGPSA